MEYWQLQQQFGGFSFFPCGDFAANRARFSPCTVLAAKMDSKVYKALQWILSNPYNVSPMNSTSIQWIQRPSKSLQCPTTSFPQFSNEYSTYSLCPLQCIHCISTSSNTPSCLTIQTMSFYNVFNESSVLILPSDTILLPRCFRFNVSHVIHCIKCFPCLTMHHLFQPCQNGDTTYVICTYDHYNVFNVWPRQKITPMKSNVRQWFCSMNDNGDRVVYRVVHGCVPRCFLFSVGETGREPFIWTKITLKGLLERSDSTNTVFLVSIEDSYYSLFFFFVIQGRRNRVWTMTFLG